MPTKRNPAAMPPRPYLINGFLAVLFAMVALQAVGLSAAPPTAPASQGASAPVPFTMSIAPLGSQIRWTKGASIVTSVTVGGTQATNVHVDASLTDDVTARQFGEADFIACPTPSSSCVPVTSLPANATQRLYLRPRADSAPAPGRYVGTIQLVADQGKSDAAQFTINVTSGFYIALGILFVALGTLLSLAVTVGVRNRMVRLQMLNAVTAVRDSLEAVEDQLNACDPKPEATPITARSIGIVRGALSIDELERANLLPRLWSVDPASFVNGANFKERIAQAAAWTTVLGHIVNLGFARIAQITAAAAQKNDAAILAAWRQVDALATNKSGAIEPAPDLAGVDNAINAAVNAAQSAVGPIGGGPPGTIDSERLNKQINMLSFASWAVAALLTTLVGSYVMVLSHNDFGRANDLWLCLFWGLGLPTVTQLSQATPSTIAGSIGITLPK